MNANYYVTKDGYLLRTGSCPQESISIQAGAGEEAHEGDPPAGMSYPPAPALPLADQKMWKWRDIKKAASIAANGGFAAGGFNWDSDLATQQRMQLTWQDMKESDGPTSVTWYTADSTQRTLTANQFKNLARALRVHLATQQDRLATLRAQIAAATTQAELDAITW